MISWLEGLTWIAIAVTVGFLVLVAVSVAYVIVDSGPELYDQDDDPDPEFWDRDFEREDSYETE